ncbi:hypothetical protein BDV96DRAFT_8528 [Lophiotrema nucula]|uniref:Uncharacterized protein n=1 Tax=Lophiotrema nucula TaxID=690887 RepID=A0A6A5ZT37_9PLEO|nr:hypothetical protein BDV96DRAFT_8528 [Lophiotrema nucula]
MAYNHISQSRHRPKYLANRCLLDVFEGISCGNRPAYRSQHCLSLMTIEGALRGYDLLNSLNFHQIQCSHATSNRWNRTVILDTPRNQFSESHRPCAQWCLSSHSMQVILKHARAATQPCIRDPCRHPMADRRENISPHMPPTPTQYPGEIHSSR